MTTLREAAQQALEALKDDQYRMVATAEGHWEYKTDLAIAALEAALAQEPTPPPEARTEAEKTAYAAGWWDALRKAQQAEPVQELPQRRPLTDEENPSFG